MDNLAIVILAAGKGTRMKSNLTKVCHLVGIKTMIEHVVDTALKLTKEVIIIVSKENINDVKSSLNNYENIRLKIQYEQLGTGHAVLSAEPCCNDRDLLVLLGDVPLITSRTLKKVINTSHDAVIIIFRNRDRENKFGRIIIKDNKVDKIVEYLDATPEERNVHLCNSGMLWIKSTHVPLLYEIKNDNKKGEYYLTDIIGIMVNKNLEIGYLETTAEECMGVNSPEELIKVNDLYKLIH